jgi:hypothetical protein
MRASWLPRATCVREQRGVMASNLEVKRDYLDSLDRTLDELASSFSVAVIGELYSDQQFGGGDSADGDVCVVGDNVDLSCAPSFQRDQGTRVENQPLH